MTGNVGDWIIKSLSGAGEFYPCKCDIFELTYGEVEDISESNKNLVAEIKKFCEQDMRECWDASYRIGYLKRTTFDEWFKSREHKQLEDENEPGQ